MSEQHFTNRRTETTTVTKVDPDGGSFTVASGWTLSNHRVPGITVGTRILVETRNLSHVVGIQDLDSGQWWYRDSDEQIAQDHADMVARHAAERQTQLDEHREEWQHRTDALPRWIRVRIASFQDSGGDGFARDGWGYELCVAELAVIYHKHGTDDEPPEHPAWDYARTHGTSGNQHGMAKALAVAHARGETLAGTVSALTPLTGNPDYSGEDR